MSFSNNSGHYIKLMVAIVALIVLTAAWKLLPLQEWILSFVNWVRGLGPIGMIVFVAVYVLAAALGLPRTPINIGAGIIFSYLTGVLLVLIAATITYFITFKIARTVAKDWVDRRIDDIPNARRIMNAVEKEGFKLVFLLRMNPFIPGVVKGYGFGTTSLPTSTYMIASILGFLPIAFAHVYLGWAGGEAMMKSSEQPSEYQSVILIGGVIVSIALVAFVSWYGHHALNKTTPDVAKT